MTTPTYADLTTSVARLKTALAALAVAGAGATATITTLMLHQVHAGETCVQTVSVYYNNERIYGDTLLLWVPDTSAVRDSLIDTERPLPNSAWPILSRPIEVCFKADSVHARAVLVT